ncbi:MAG: four helix bundle protein [Chthoniobacterales bacterium]
MSDEQKPQSYRDSLVWQKGISLAKDTYRVTQHFPSDEKFGLISQMRRAAVSVPSNIAEGQARHTTGSFIQFISNAEGSLAELDTQFVISLELSFISDRDAASIFDQIAELRRMLNGLRRRLQEAAKLVTNHSSHVTTN